MRSLRPALVSLAGAAALLAALAAALPAAAGGGQPAVTLSMGWGTTDLAGGGTAAVPSWVPLTAVVTIPSGHPDFSGRLVVRPRSFGPGLQAAPGGSGSSLQEDISVRAGSVRTFTLYGFYAGDGTAAFEAALIDAQGQQAVSDSAAIRPNYVAVGVLSDAPAAPSLLRGVVVGPTTGKGLPVRAHRFERADQMPSSALQLSGFHALVIDDFDSSALSQAQARALRDYVGLGGALILAGGSGWRRTFAQLPEDLVPLRPSGTSSASLNSVLELVGGSSEVAVPVATGTPARGARVVLTDQAGTPLYSEAGYGSGRIVELAFDPSRDPVLGTPLGFQAWAEALNRAIPADRLPNGTGARPLPLPLVPPVSPVPAGATGTGTPAIGIAAPALGATAVPTGSGPGLEGQVYEALTTSPASALPPLGILGALLLAYILLAGPVNYAWTKTARRRELTWVTVPLLAVLFTSGAYGAGIVYKGSDFLVNEVQLLRVAPTGNMDVTLVDVLFAPRRGDFVIQAPEGSLASTLSQYTQAGGAPDHILAGQRPRLALNGFQVWGQRNFKVELTAGPGPGLESHLSLAGTHVVGSVVNRGTETVSNLALLTVSGEWASIGTLGPGSTVQVDSPLDRIPAYSTGGGACKGSPAGLVTDSRVGACPALTANLTASALVTLAEVAAASSLMTRSDVQILVGTVDPLPGVSIEGHQPSRHSVAAIAEPVLLDSLDSLPGGWSGSRLVTDQRLAGGEASLEVRDYDLPGRITSPLALTYGTPGVPAPAKAVPAPGGGTVGVELYDWTQRSWTRLPAGLAGEGAGCVAGGLGCHLLTPAEIGSGIVRVRTRSVLTSNLRIELTTARPGPA